MTNNGNRWSEMGAAEWRGKVGEKLEQMESLMAAVCAKVDTHDKTLAVLEDRGVRSQLSWGAKAAIISSLIIALASIATAIIK